jgi:hypothetical protein
MTGGREELAELLRGAGLEVVGDGRAAKDPRLSAASAVRLLDDPDRSVSYAAGLHPGLPARLLVRLLRDTDTDTAEEAARHPALPVPVMERLLERLRPDGDVPAG